MVRPLTTRHDALIALGQLCEALANQDTTPRVRWEFIVEIEAGTVALAIALDNPVTVGERDLMLQAATRITALARSKS